MLGPVHQPGRVGCKRGVNWSRPSAGVTGPLVEAIEGVVPALETVAGRARTGDRVVVFGSFLTVGPALAWPGIEV